MLKYLAYTAAFLFMWIAPSASAASRTLTDKAFLRSGSGAFIGRVVDVQVLSSTQTSETGSVQLQVTQVITGNIGTQFIKLPYERTLVPADEESNWDLVEPVYESLKKVALGKEYLIFVSESNGTYLLSPASNAVQDASKGLLVGTIKAQHRESDHHTVEVKIEIGEMIFGWIEGIEVTMQFDKEHTCAQSNKSNREMPFVANLMEDWPEYRDKKLIIAFANKKVCGISRASDEFFRQLKTADFQ